MTKLDAKILPLPSKTKQSESFAYSKERGKHKGVVLKGTSTAVFDDVTQLYTKESRLRLLWAYSSAG